MKNPKKRISRKQYNKELDEAVARIEKGEFVSHKDALKELSKKGTRHSSIVRLDTSMH